MIWRIIDLTLFGVVIVMLERNRRATMSFGQETQAALAELDAAISAEIDEFADYIVRATGADGTLAAAIRERAERIKGIVPDSADAGEVVTPDPDVPGDNSGEPVEPEPEDPATEDPTAPATDADATPDAPADVPLLTGDDVDDEDGQRNA